MNALGRFWRDLPFPVQILLGIVLGVALFQLFSGLGWLLVTLAVLLWLVALVGLAYARGGLRPPGPPALVTALARLTGGQPGVAGTRRPGPTAAGASVTARSGRPAAAVPPAQAERERLLAGVQSALGALCGVDRAKEQLGELVEKIKVQRKHGASGFGTDAPGVVILLAGPRGVGKTSMARQLAPLFCGLGAIPTPVTVEAGPAELSPRLGGAVIEQLRALTERALDAVLLLDDMDWAVTGDTAGLASGTDLGPTLTALAQANPGRLVVAMTMSRGAADRLQNDPERGAWLRKLLGRRIDFDPLPVEVLTDLLTVQIERRHHRMPPAVAQRAARLLKKMAEGADFDNASAVRRLADDLTQHAAARTAGGEDETSNNSTITEADVRACE